VIIILIKMERKKEVYCLNCMRKYEDDGYPEQLCSECRRKLGSVYKSESKPKREILNAKQQKMLRRASLDIDVMLLFVFFTITIYIIAVFV